MPEHTYTVTYRYQNGPDSQEVTLTMHGKNPFHAFENFRKTNPLPIVWSSQIVSIVRQL